MRNWRGAVLALAVLALVASACGGGNGEIASDGESPVETGSPDSDEASGDPIKVGLIAPLTGPLASVGQVAKRGFDVAIQAINDEGGVLGRPLESVEIDDGCDPQTSLEGAQELIQQEQVAVIVQGTCSSAALASADFINQSGVINMLGLPTTSELTDPSVHPYNFQTIVSSQVNGASLGQVATDQGFQSIVLAPEDLAFGKSQIEAAAEHLDELGNPAVATVEFPADATDMTTYVQQMADAGPDLIIGCTQPPAFSKIFDAMSRLGVTTPVMGCLGITTPEMIELAGETIPDGTMSVVMNQPFWLDVPRINTFREAYVDMWDSVPRNPSDVHMYDAVRIWADAAETAGTLEGEAVKETLESGAEFENTGSKVVSFSPDDHTMWSTDEMFTVYLVTTDEVKGSGYANGRSFLDEGTLEEIGVPVPEPSG